jgi:hypothetical protein
MKNIVLALFVILLVLLGCSRGPSKQNVQEDYHVGTQGVEINFLTNSPPSRIYDGDTLDIAVEVKNRGAYPSGQTFQGKLEIGGFDPASIRGSWDGGNSIPTSLEGKNQYNPEGGYAVMTYKDRSGVRVPFDADYYEPNILIHSCYKYETTADVMVCIDPEPYKVVEERKVCNMDSGVFSTGGSQGAPIAVTKVEEEVGSDKIYFRVYFSNAGSGSVMLPSSYSQCPFDLKLEDLDKVVATVKLPYDASPECSPKGTASDPVRLTNGQGYMFCKFAKPATQSAYTTSLNIKAEYVYSSSISKQIRIINIQ